MPTSGPRNTLVARVSDESAALFSTRGRRGPRLPGADTSVKGKLIYLVNATTATGSKALRWVGGVAAWLLGERVAEPLAASPTKLRLHQPTTKLNDYQVMAMAQ